MTIALWRVATDTPDWTADDLSGKGAAANGARWNHPGERVGYAATSISLAAWKPCAHPACGAELPWSRDRVGLAGPGELRRAREVLAGPPRLGWDAIREARASRKAGADCIESGRSAPLAVPSAIIEEEDNVLIRAQHPDSMRVVATTLHRFVCDPRV